LRAARLAKLAASLALPEPLELVPTGSPAAVAAPPIVHVAAQPVQKRHAVADNEVTGLAGGLRKGDQFGFDLVLVEFENLATPQGAAPVQRQIFQSGVQAVARAEAANVRGAKRMQTVRLVPKLQPQPVRGRRNQPAVVAVAAVQRMLDS